VTITIKRRFAVMLEDAIEVPLPDDLADADPDTVEEWALEHYDELYAVACERALALERGAAPGPDAEQGPRGRVPRRP
jgi:hypothetical protein